MHIEITLSGNMVSTKEMLTFTLYSCSLSILYLVVLYLGLIHVVVNDTNLINMTIILYLG